MGYKAYCRFTGLDVLSTDRALYYQFAVVHWFNFSNKYLQASSLKHVAFVQKVFKNRGKM